MGIAILYDMIWGVSVIGVGVTWLGFNYWVSLVEFVSKDEIDPLSCWVDILWKFFMNSSTLFGIIVGGSVGVEMSDMQELSSLT